MARVAPARRRSRSWIFVLLLLGAVGGLMLAPAPARELEAMGSRLLEPLQASVSSVAGQAEDVTSVVRRMTELSRQNDQYREEIDRLQAEIARLRELEVENRDLRNLLGLKQRAGTGELLPVRVIARDPSPFVQAITLDRGTEDGVQEGMTIITWRGVVGRVSRVSPTSSKVLLITDTSSSISGRIQSSEQRVTGIIRGRPEGGLLMQRIPQEETLQTGETVVTSDFGGLMPEGLVIGQIVQIRRKDVDVLQEAVIEPSADMKRLERLYVLLSPADGR
ncbi:MAG TPA: rod shape-determining protein MreC [Chloroflexota bacterium]|nr:rod shape-determining protein MreC [Chloroflexota bacterium]